MKKQAGNACYNQKAAFVFQSVPLKPKYSGSTIWFSFIVTSHEMNFFNYILIT